MSYSKMPTPSTTNVNTIYGAHLVTAIGILAHRSYPAPEYFVKTFDLAEHYREIEFIWNDTGKTPPGAMGIGDLVQVTGQIAWVHINAPYDENITIRLEHVAVTLVGARFDEEPIDER